MFSKIMIFLLMFSLTSCGLKLNDTVQKSSPVNVEENCFSKIDEVTEKYYQGDLSSSEILGFKKCALNTIEIFRNYVAGDDKKLEVEKRSHKKEELKRFFQKVIFTEGKTVTESMVNSLMSFKVSIIGGNEEIITNKELTVLKNWVEIIADSFERVNPFMDLISKKARTKSTLNKNLKQQVSLLEKELNYISYNFIKQLPEDGKAIRIGEIKTIAIELMKFYGWNEVNDKKARLANTETVFGLFDAIKEALFDEDDGDFITKKQWGPFLESLNGSYRSYLSGQLAVEQFKSGIFNYELIHDSVDSAIKVVNKSLNSYMKDSELPAKRVDNIISAAYGFKAINSKYKLESIKAIYKVLINKLFNPFYDTENSKKIVYEGITKNHIGYLTSFKNSWFNSVKLISKKRFWKTALWSIRDYIKPFFIEYDFSAGLSYETFEEKSHLSVKNLIMINSMDHLVRLIIKAYAENDMFAANDIGLTADEIQEFTDDIRPILLDLKLINPDIIDAGDRMYFEGNLFTPTGNGFPIEPVNEESKNALEGIFERISDFKRNKNNDIKRVKKIFYNADDSQLKYEKLDRKLLERDEMVNMGIYIFSSATASDKMYQKLVSKDKGCAVSDKSIKDLYCKKMVPRKCFEENLFPMMDAGLSGLKELNQFIFKDKHEVGYTNNEKELEAFKEVMMSSITLPGEDTSQLGYMHVVKLAQISHYVETSILRFDIDKNGRIDKNEVDRAYPHFEGLIDKMVKSADVKSLEAKREKKLNKLHNKYIDNDISTEQYLEIEQKIKEVYARKIKKAIQTNTDYRSEEDLKGFDKAWSKVKRKAGEIKNSFDKSIGYAKRKNIFLHMMAYGEIPTSSDVLYAATVQKVKGWKIDINRLKAFGIFGGVINSVNADSENQEDNFSYRASYYDIVCD